MASTTYLTRTPSSAGNRKTFTFSAWIKGQTHNPAGTTGGTLFSCGTHISNGPMFIIDFLNGQNLRVEDTLADGSQPINLRTNRVFRDTNAWYHIVVTVDTTQGSSTDRVKIYVNGVQETSLSHTVYPGQNIDTSVNNTHVHVIGSRAAGLTNKYFDGCMSHVHFVDGTAYPASTFGSTDSTTGEWKINTAPNITMGTNGFTILKDGNTITDQSSNSNNWTLAGGTLTKTEDNPSNVFATLNPLVPYDAALSYTKGNTVVAYSGSGGDSWTTRWGVSSIGMTAGKYYAEAKVAAIGTNQMYAIGLVKDVGTFTPTSSIGTDGVGYYSTGGIFKLSNQTQTVASYTTNDIIGIAFDRDNGTVQWYKNGSAIGSAETGLSTDGTWFFVSNFYSSGKVAVNFGNGVFEETAVSSAGTNASNLGIFEYDVPSGYTALCTKGLNE